jgi:glycosyltransferase involved in cell wall biosynthesis
MAGVPKAATTPEAADRLRLLEYKGGIDAAFSIPGYIARAVAPSGYQFGAVVMNLQLGPSLMRGRLPLVSCLMVTRDRFELARFSVACFQRQTWPNRELVVLDGSADDRLRDWIAGLGDPSIRWVSSRSSPASLGALRNRSIELARGEALCIWDDDDLHHPARVEVAMAAMSAARTPVCLLARLTLWMLADRKVGVMARGPWPQENTLVAMKSAGLRYASVDRAEDTPAVRDLLSRHRGILVNAPELYVYVIHGGNTWDREHHKKLWDVATERAEGAAYEARLTALGRAYPIETYSAALRQYAAEVRALEAGAR